MWNRSGTENTLSGISEANCSNIRTDRNDYEETDFPGFLILRTRGRYRSCRPILLALIRINTKETRKKRNPPTADRTEGLTWKEDAIFWPTTAPDKHAQNRKNIQQKRCFEKRRGFKTDDNQITDISTGGIDGFPPPFHPHRPITLHESLEAQDSHAWDFLVFTQAVPSSSLVTIPSSVAKRFSLFHNSVISVSGLFRPTKSGHLLPQWRFPFPRSQPKNETETPAVFPTLSACSKSGPHCRQRSASALAIASSNPVSSS